MMRNDKPCQSNRKPFRHPRDAKVEIHIQDGADLLLRNHLPEHNFDARVFLLKAAHELVDQTAQQRDGHETQFDAPDFATCGLARNGGRIGGFAQHVPRALGKRSPGSVRDTCVLPRRSTSRTPSNDSSRLI